jgi:predicted acylesterase/phospholipase RssA
MAEMTYQYENIIFQGGSSKGIIYVGALRALREKKILGGIKRFAGTSVGSLVAALLALDFSVEEIYVGMKTLLGVMRNFGEGVNLMELWRLYASLGANPSNPIEDVLRDVIGKKYNPEITMKEAYNITRKYLVIVTCNVNKECPIYIHANAFPDVKVIDALMASISIPIFFVPREYDFLGETDYYIDGGTVDNYPIWVFNDLEKLNKNPEDIENIDKDCITEKTLGLKILDPMDKSMEGDLEKSDTRKNIKGLVGYITAVMNSMILQIERAHVSESYKKQTLGLEVPRMGFADFRLSNEEISNLMNMGYKQTLKKLEKNENLIQV